MFPEILFSTPLFDALRTLAWGGSALGLTAGGLAEHAFCLSQPLFAATKIHKKETSSRKKVIR